MSSLRTVIWPLLRPYRWPLIGATALNAIHGVALSLQSLMPKWLIDDVVMPTDLSPNQRLQQFLWLAAAYLVVALIGRMVVWHCGYRIFTWVRERAVLSLRSQFFRHVNALCLRFHLKHSSGELFSYLFGSPLATVMGFYQQTSMFFVASVVTVVTTIITTAWWDPIVAAVLLGTVVASVAMMDRSRRMVKAIHSDYQQAESEVTGQVNDLLRGNKAVKLHAMEERVAATFEQEALRIGRKSYERDIRTHLQWMKQEGFGYFAFATLMGVAAWRHQIGAISIGEISASLVAFEALRGPLQQIFASLTSWGSAQASIERLRAVLDAASTTPDPPADQAPVVLPPAGELALEGVHFAYGDKPVLIGVDLRIPYGQRIALVGPSGAGKSTVSQLLMRLYDPNQGRVTIAGIDLRRFKGNELRRRFGVVPQDPFLFRSSIRDNLKVARPDADDAQLRHALELANAWEFVSERPEGLDTRLGEGGADLSGGQRQRLAIARALLADTPYFVFDEATSALDTLSEDLIQRSLDTVLAGRTAIIIAHRLATVQHCDRIIVLADGRIAQDGTFTALANQPGIFQDLVQGQQLRA